MVVYTMYTMFGTGFGDWAGTTTNVYFEGILILEAITGAVAQSFFLERAFVLCKKKKIMSYVLLGICIPSILAGLCCGLASGAITVLSSAGAGTNFADFSSLTYLITGWKAVTVFTDLVLTTSIVSSLMNSRTGWRQTDSAVTRLVRWIVEAQALPLIAALFFLTSYAADSGGNICLIPSFAEAKLCCISVLHVLNSRGRLRHDLSTEHASNKNSGLTTKGRVQIQTVTIQEASPSDNYDPESQRHARNHQVRASRMEDPDEISLESFENKGTGSSRRSGDSFPVEEERGSSQAKLVTPAVPFEQMRW
ncbi:hypothetical protein BDY24DRAFT_378942 [Mrakia frigida]|uniref:DUF6534 domain-containing protein n=1 Tax=Mrakia frigida TaxID=29902 RepID=UPI003FCC0937